MIKYFLLILTLLLTNFLLAQDEDSYVYGDTETELKKDTKNGVGGGIDWSRVSVGGGLGMTFGTVTYIEIAPTVSYFVTDHFLYGVGLNYMYYEDKNVRFETHSFGGKVFSQYLLDILPVLAHVEAEVINADSYSHPGERVNVVNLYVGGGLSQRMGDRSYLYILMLWNLNDYNDSVLTQPNPIMRIGIGVGI